MGALTVYVEYSDDTNAIVLSVSGAPEQGVAGLFIDAGALRFDPDTALVVGVHGANDFTILSHHFDNVEGEASVVAVNPAKGIRNGAIASLSVLRVGEGELDIDVDPAGVHLVDSYNRGLEAFELRSS